MTGLEMIQSRIRERLKTLGLSARSVSIEATGKADAINNILNKGAVPSYDRLIAISKALSVSVNYLTGLSDLPAPDPWDVAEGAPPLPNPFETPKDIPVYGSASGGFYDGAEGVSGDGNPSEVTVINNEEVIDFFRRPAALLLNRRVYGLYVSGTSMEPVFESGSAVVIDPVRPPSPRDFVIVYLSHPPTKMTGWVEREPSAVLIKRLVRRTATYVELEQYNPASTFRVPTDEVTAIHRVVSTAEMLGT